MPHPPSTKCAYAPCIFVVLQFAERPPLRGRASPFDDVWPQNRETFLEPRRVRLDLRITPSVPRKSSIDCIFDPHSAFTVSLCSCRLCAGSNVSSDRGARADAGGTLADRCSDLQAFVVVSIVEISERAVRRCAANQDRARR
jgi:hypothetical protein